MIDFLDFLKNDFFGQSEAACWVLQEDGVWLSIPISDSVSFCFAIGMLLWEINHIKSKTNASAKDQS